jgi:hypothetical protein
VEVPDLCPEVDDKAVVVSFNIAKASPRFFVIT